MVYAPLYCQFDSDTYLGRINEYTQVHIQYSCRAVSPDSYVPSTGTQLNLCTSLGLVYYCVNPHLLINISEQTCALTIYYQVEYVMKAMCLILHL